MTSGIRDLCQFHRALASNDVATACGWTTSEYYCAVVPSDTLCVRFAEAPEVLQGILAAIAARMRFNRWHYMPGHFAEQPLPAARHFYFPPQMPDTAVWCDQHHQGHIHAGVRYSIRAPIPLEVGGRVYPGMFDLRLMRMAGSSYTFEEMTRAMHHAEALGRIYQALSDAILESRAPVKIESFHTQWYKQYVSERLASLSMPSHRKLLGSL